MLQKTIGLYTDTANHSPFSKDALFMEIATNHIVVFVKSENDERILALEFYKIEVENNDWQEIFYDFRKQSALLDKNFNTTHIFYNFPEVVMIPAFKFYAGTVNNFINLVFGEIEEDVIKYDALNMQDEKVYVAYRANHQLHETIQRNFLAINEYHTYSGILKNYFADKEPKRNAINITFYQKNFIAFIVKKNKLQLIQHFNYHVMEDVLYHTLNMAEKMNISTEHDLLTIAGDVENNDKIVAALKQHFKHIYFSVLEDGATTLEKINQYPSHYFSSFFNLMV